MKEGYPLLIVFYLDKEMMMNPDIIKPFADSVNDALAQRKANALAFFLPTEGVERVECINPIQVEDADMARINKIIEDIKNNFDIGNGADEGKDNPDNEISLIDVDVKSDKHFSFNWDYKGYDGETSPYTQTDWNQTLMTKLNQVNANIFQASGRGGYDTIITSNKVERILNTILYYTPGKLSNNKVIISNEIEEDKILLTSNQHEYTGSIDIENYTIDDI